MGTLARHRERRRWYRVPIRGTASVWQGQRLGGFYSVHDVSPGGCCLRDGPDCDFDDSVEIMLHVPKLELLHVPVRIVRHTSFGELGVRFVEDLEPTEDRLHDLYLASLEEAHGLRPRRAGIEPPIVERFDPQNDHTGFFWVPPQL